MSEVARANAMACWGTRSVMGMLFGAPPPAGDEICSPVLPGMVLCSRSDGSLGGNRIEGQSGSARIILPDMTAEVTPLAPDGLPGETIAARFDAVPAQNRAQGEAEGLVTSDFEALPAVDPATPPAARRVHLLPQSDGTALSGVLTFTDPTADPLTPTRTEGLAMYLRGGNG